MIWYYRSSIDEIARIRDYVDSLQRQMYEGSPQVLLPSIPARQKMLPCKRISLDFQMSEREDEIVVSVVLTPDVSRQDITITLVDPRSLEISCDLRGEMDEGAGRYRVHEWESKRWMITLSGPVTEHGSTASFSDGLLEIHLRKNMDDQKRYIVIE